MTRRILLSALPLAASCGIALAAPAPQKAGAPAVAAAKATGSVIDFREGPMPAIVSFEEKGGIVSVVVTPPDANHREPLAPVGSLVLSATRSAARPSTGVPPVTRRGR
jgi:hypothetical protein